MSLCDRHSIPECLLRVPRALDDNVSEKISGISSSSKSTIDCTGNGDVSISSDESSDTSSDDGFEDDIILLRQYSFISDTIDTKIFGMHSLVQYATQKWLRTNGQFEECKKFTATACTCHS